MRKGSIFAGTILAATLLALPLVSFADMYARAGGKAYHVRNTCPALNGYKVVEVSSTAGLTPCRICCKDAFEQEEAGTSGMKLDQPRALTIQDMSGTNKQAEATSNNNDDNSYFYDGSVWDPIHYGPRGAFVVSNGQPIRVGSRGAAVARAGGFGHR